MSEAARLQPLEPDMRPRLMGSLSRLGVIQPLIIALALSILSLPMPIILLGNDADTSLIMLLDYARKQHLQFGVDFVNTYGPLGFLIFPCYSGEAVTLRLLADLMLSFATLAGLCVLAWHQAPLWRGLLLLIFLWVTANTAGPELRMNVMLLSWGVLCLLNSQQELTYCAFIAAALAGFCALAKVSFLIVTAGYMLLLAVDVGRRAGPRLAFGMLAVFATVFLLGWCGAGQGLENVPTFLGTAFATVRGYHSALTYEGRESLRDAGAAVASLAIVVVVLRCANAFRGEPGRGGRRLLIAACTLWLTFTAWKHGFVRMDSYHAALFLGFLPVMLLGLESLPGGSDKAAVWMRSAGLACSLVSVAALQFFCLPSLQASLVAPWHSAKLNLRRLVQPGEFRRELAGRLEAHRAEGQLPKLRQIVQSATVDVFGFRQSYALHNGMNFRPRPVSQSYAACNSKLMRLNERFLLSGMGADFFLFELDSLDSKFPALEDAMVLRHLLLNFEPVETEERFVLLKRRSFTEPKLRLVREANIKPGEPIDLRQNGSAKLWIQFELSPTVWGRLRQLVCQAPVVRLAAWSAPGGELIYRHQGRAGLLASGFVASPLLRWTREMADSKSAPRPGAYTLELNGHERCWESAVRVRVFEMVEAPTGAAGLDAKTSDEKAQARPFKVFRKQGWRPDLPPVGGVGETLAYGVILLLPVAGAGALVFFARRLRRLARLAPTKSVILWNLLLLGTMSVIAWAAAETWFRFFYDTTDSLGSTRVCERWVERHWRVNAAGCRDNLEYSPALPPGQRRVTFLGDSFTAGHGIKNVEDRFPNLLRQRHPEWQFHVMANVGLDTGAEAVLVNRLHSQGYAFDRVVLVYCLNDIGDLIAHDQAFVRLFEEMRPHSWFVRNSYVLDLLTQRYRAGRNPYMRNYFSYVRDAYRDKTWERQKARLRELRAAVESSGGKLMVVTFPFFDVLGPDYPYAAAHKALDEFWREQAVPELDLLPIYAHRPAGELVVNRHDAHPNEVAHHLAANAIDDFLFPKKGIER